MAGQNAAYDQFPCQYQIFYRGKARNSMWYDPVFQVSALNPASLSRRERSNRSRTDDEGRAHNEQDYSQMNPALCAVGACSVGVLRCDPGHKASA